MIDRFIESLKRAELEKDQALTATEIAEMLLLARFMPGEEDIEPALPKLAAPVDQPDTKPQIDKPSDQPLQPTQFARPSDCDAPGWFQGEANQLLVEWGRSAVLFQVLPRHFWPGTAMAEVQRVQTNRQDKDNLLRFHRLFEDLHHLQFPHHV